MRVDENSHESKLSSTLILVWPGLYTYPLEDCFPCYIKEIKNTSECIVELYKHAGIFKNTREVHREARLEIFNTALGYASYSIENFSSIFVNKTLTTVSNP